jgi:hypothetical protein
MGQRIRVIEFYFIISKAHPQHFRIRPKKCLIFNISISYGKG